jgi:integrase
MALELSIYNRQTLTSKTTNKTYQGYACVFTPGQSGRLSEADQVGPFYIRDQKGGKQWLRLEARTIGDAKTEAIQAQTSMAAGIPVVSSSEDGQKLTSRIAVYLNEVESNKALNTWRAYNRSLELFKESCHRANVQDVRREDLLAFKTYLRNQGSGDRAIHNHFLNVSVFLKWAGHRLADMKLTKYDWPAKPERDPEEYTADEIEALLTAAASTYRGLDRAANETHDDRLLLQAFLCSGFRHGEIAHLTYGDIDGNHSLWSVRPKAGHTLKTRESQRVVPVPEWLTKRVLDQKTRDGKHNDDLVFPSVGGKANEHSLTILKRVAEKAGLTGRIDQHKFRSTAITMWLRNGSTVPETMDYVGHVNPATILRYAAKVNLQKKENRDKVTQPFNRFSSVGD